MFVTRITFSFKRIGGNVVERARKAELRKAELLAAGEARKAIFRPYPGVKERTFDSSGFSAEGTLISTSAVPKRKRRKRGGSGAEQSKEHFRGFSSSFFFFFCFFFFFFGQSPDHHLTLIKCYQP